MFDFSRKKSVDIERFIAESVEGLKLATSAHSETWNLGEEETWDINQDDGLIVFKFANGMTAKAPVQIIGTFNSNDDTFMWGWDHPSIVSKLQSSAKRVKEFAIENKIKELLKQTIACNQDRAWEYSALAMRLTEANCAYRAEASPGTYVFMNFGEVSLEKET